MNLEKIPVGRNPPWDVNAIIEIPLGGAPVTVRLPAGTSNGRTLRVLGKGATRKDGSRGDLLVTIDVAVPQKLDNAAREALQKFQDATAGQDPRQGLVDGARGV